MILAEAIVFQNIFLCLAIQFVFILSTMTQSPRRLLNYTLGREIGRGGMASVWYAENSVGRKFAVKLLKPELVAGELSIAERFRNEAQIMVRLEHPAILRVEDFYEEGTTLAIIMEYLVGHDLNQYIRSHGPLSEAQAVEWFTQILDAFAYVHQKGYFHRDVKPANMFLTETGLIKVMDFGIAKIVGDDLSLTQTDMLMGSPLYMSPEQITSPKSVDFRTDIYSLGVTLHALLTGKKPYDDAETSMFQIQSAIVHDPLPRLSHVSDAVNAAIQRATQKKPADRFANCTEFAQVLTSQATLNDDETILKPSASRMPLPLSDEATVVRSGTAKKNAPLPNDDETVVRSRPDQRATPTPEPSATTPSTVPASALVSGEASPKNRLPLLAAMLAVLTILGVGGWFFWSGQSKAGPAQVALANTSPATNSAPKNSPDPANGDVNRAISFYGKQRYDSAFALFNRYRNSPALTDNAEAMTDLGIIYFYGAPDQQIPQDVKQAGEWLQKGVQKQNPKACYFLGLLKDGVDLSTPAKSKARGQVTAAVDLYRKGAELGDPYAQATLGELFLMRNPFVLHSMDACQVLDYVKQAYTKNIVGAFEIYNELKESKPCTR